MRPDALFSQAQSQIVILKHILLGKQYYPGL